MVELAHRGELLREELLVLEVPFVEQLLYRLYGRGVME